jgi:hypothetical protein
VGRKAGSRKKYFYPIEDLPTIALKNVIIYQDKKMLVRVVQHRLNSYQINIT